jgi:hypothetical protein
MSVSSLSHETLGDPVFVQVDLLPELYWYILGSAEKFKWISKNLSVILW